MPPKPSRRQGPPLVVDAAGGPLRTIADAVAAAAPGARIVVRAGTYRESLDLATSVTLEGEGEVVISSPEGPAVRVSRGSATLSGLRLGALSGQDVIVLEEGARLTLARAHVAATDAVCLRVGPKSSVVVEDVTVDRRGDLALVVGGARAFLRAVRLRCVGGGIGVFDGATASVEDSVVEGAEVGLDVQGGASASLARSRLAGTPTAHLIQVVESHLLVDRCQLHGLHDTSLLALGGARVAWVETDVEGATSGVHAEGDADVDVRRSRIAGAASFALAALDGARIGCRDAELAGGSNGVEANGGHLVLERCAVSGGAAGVVLDLGGTATLRGGRAAGGDEPVIEDAPGTTCTIDGTELVTGVGGVSRPAGLGGRVIVVDPPSPPGRATSRGGWDRLPFAWVPGAGQLGFTMGATAACFVPLAEELAALDEPNGHGIAAWVDAQARRRFGDRAAGLALDPEADTVWIGSADVALVADVLDMMAELL